MVIIWKEQGELFLALRLEWNDRSWVVLVYNIYEMLKYEIKFYFKGFLPESWEKKCIVYALSTLHLCEIIKELVKEYKLISVKLLDK